VTSQIVRVVFSGVVREYCDGQLYKGHVTSDDVNDDNNNNFNFKYTLTYARKQGYNWTKTLV
jgi:hypothetical protein